MDQLGSLDLFRHILLSDFLRYFITAASAYLFFWVVFKKHWQQRIIQKKPFQNGQLRREFGYSMSTVFIFACIGFGIFWLKKHGYTLIYHGIDDRGWPWFFVSILLMVLLHDTYFYWTHRFMHHPKIFRHVHLVHHQSTNPSPWAAYSFHPFEAILEAGIFVIVVLCIPAHPLALFVFLIYGMLRNVLGHLGIEIFPKDALKNPWLKWQINATHHDLHHKDFHYNYGFYFTWWDKLCGTEHPYYEAVFDEVVSQTCAQTEAIAAPKKAISKKALLLAAALIFSQMLCPQTPRGIWKTIDDGDGEARSLVQIELSGEEFSGKVLDIFPRNCESPEPLCTKCPGERKNKPVKGMDILWGFKKTSDGWSNGRILDPANGKTYRCKMWLENGGNTLKVRGYWGIFWRTQTWYRNR